MTKTHTGLGYDETLDTSYILLTGLYLYREVQLEIWRRVGANSSYTCLFKMVCLKEYDG